MPGHLVYFVAIWYIFDVCAKKNLATLWQRQGYLVGRVIFQPTAFMLPCHYVRFVTL
jgi:hypothetical protein